jgi:hypothetical protein
MVLSPLLAFYEAVGRHRLEHTSRTELESATSTEVSPAAVVCRSELDGYLSVIQDGDGSAMDRTGANPATHLVYTGAAVNPF